MCKNMDMMVKACRGCGLLFMPAKKDEDRCALCAPKKRNRPIDLFEEWRGVRY